MNDPNGLVYYHGEYHLFFQYNPNGDDRGETCRGATRSARDLVHWQELPVAIPQDGDEYVFSGSAVVDRTTQRVRHDGQPGDGRHLHRRATTGKQAQALAYSLDRAARGRVRRQSGARHRLG